MNAVSVLFLAGMSAWLDARRVPATPIQRLFRGMQHRYRVVPQLRWRLDSETNLNAE